MPSTTARIVISACLSSRILPTLFGNLRYVSSFFNDGHMLENLLTWFWKVISLTTEARKKEQEYKVTKSTISSSTASVPQSQQLVLMAPGLYVETWKRSLSPDPPLIAAIVAVVFAMNVVILMAWCVSRNGRFQRAYLRRYTALGTRRVHGSSEKKDPSWDSHSLPRKHRSGRHKTDTHAIDLWRAAVVHNPIISEDKQAFGRPSEKKTKTKKRITISRGSQGADTNSVYSSASAPLHFHDQLFRSRPFTLILPSDTMPSSSGSPQPPPPALMTSSNTAPSSRIPILPLPSLKEPSQVPPSSIDAIAELLMPLTVSTVQPLGEQLPQDAAAPCSHPLPTPGDPESRQSALSSVDPPSTEEHAHRTRSNSMSPFPSGQRDTPLPPIPIPTHSRKNSADPTRTTPKVYWKQKPEP